MSNIMLTDLCNLRCPYCFANEFVNKTADEISMTNFKAALDFIAKDGSSKEVGLIGGEPTLHSKFQEMLRLLINDERFLRVMIYTNGISTEMCLEELSDPKVNLLINCNSPSDIGITQYQKMCDNLDDMVQNRNMRNQITLGINMYRKDFEYDYILELLNKYGLMRVRVSISVPTYPIPDAKSYFVGMKERVKEFFSELKKQEIVPFFDCNKLPSCLIGYEDFSSSQTDLTPMEQLDDSDIRSEVVRCVPVVDILQDLSAVRCFGLSGDTKVKINDFKNLGDLKNYYRWLIDSFAYHAENMPECHECYRRKTLKCMGGCLVFKLNDIKCLCSQSKEVPPKYQEALSL